MFWGQICIQKLNVLSFSVRDCVVGKRLQLCVLKSVNYVSTSVLVLLIPMFMMTVYCYHDGNQRVCWLCVTVQSTKLCYDWLFQFVTLICVAKNQLIKPEHNNYSIPPIFKDQSRTHCCDFVHQTQCSWVTKRVFIWFIFLNILVQRCVDHTHCQP